jgi:hypothetical protein
MAALCFLARVDKPAAVRVQADSFIVCTLLSGPFSDCFAQENHGNLP